ncbi:MAG: hypothetical protein AAF899_00835 [Pseudomonadota bacterium]
MAFATAAALLTGLAAGGAAAQDWQVTGRLSQELSAETNRGLDSDPEASVGSTTTLSLTAGLDTPRTRWTLGSSVSLRAFTGAEEDDDVDVVSPAFNAGVAHRGIGWDLGGSFSFRRSNTSFNTLVSAVDFGDVGGGDVGGDPGDTGGDTGDIGGDTGGDVGGDAGAGGDTGGGDGVGTDLVTDRDATRTDISVGGRLSLNLTRRDTVAMDIGTAVVRFSEDDTSLEPSTSFSLGSTFSRRVSALTTLSGTLSGRRILIDDEENTRSTGITARLGVSRQMSPRLTASFSGGATVSLITQDETAASGAEESVTVSPSTTGSITYLEGDTRIGLSLSQAVSPSSDGDITDRTSISASFSQPINRTQSFNVATGFSRSSSTDGDGETTLGFEIAPSYSIAVTQDWNASIAYRFRLGSDEDETTTSNGVFLSVSRPLRLY